MSKLTSLIDEASDLIAEAGVEATASEAQTEELRLELKTKGKSTSSKRTSRTSKTGKMTTADHCKAVMEHLRAMSEIGDIVAIEHKSLSKAHDDTDCLNRFAIPQIFILGEPENDWEDNGRTCYIKS